MKPTLLIANAICKQFGGVKALSDVSLTIRKGEIYGLIGPNGSGKTTTAAHLAQKLALDGYRVLAIDLDPQASLSALHGVQPEFDLNDGGTLYDAIRYDDPVPLRDVVQKTYFTNLDLIPGNLELTEFEHDTPRALTERTGKFFFTRIGDALAEVEGGK